MKKWATRILLITLILSIFITPSFAEETFGEGEWIFELPASAEFIDEAALVSADPVIPDSLEKTIFNGDSRITVNNPAQYPYSAICYMVMKYECGCRSSGTGFLAGTTSTVFTAAHCVVCTDHGKWAEGITFYFGYKNSRNYLYKYDGRWYAYAGNIFSSNQYSTAGDYAIIKLYENVGDRTGTLGVKWCLSDSEIATTYVYAAGYRDETLRYDQGFVTPLSTEHLKHQLDILPGNSGGPLFTSDNYAVGINISQNDLYNTSYRITYDVYEAYESVKQH